MKRSESVSFIRALFDPNQTLFHLISSFINQEKGGLAIFQRSNKIFHFLVVGIGGFFADARSLALFNGIMKTSILCRVNAIYFLA
jgi:hypothetical protein